MYEHTVAGGRFNSLLDGIVQQEVRHQNVDTLGFRLSSFPKAPPQHRHFEEREV